MQALALHSKKQSMLPMPSKRSTGQNNRREIATGKGRGR